MRKACPSCCVTSSSGSAGTQPLLRINAPPQAGRGWRAACRNTSPLSRLASVLFFPLPPPPPRPHVKSFSTSVFPGARVAAKCVSRWGWQQLPAWAGEMLKGEREAANCSAALAVLTFPQHPYQAKEAILLE